MKLTREEQVYLWRRRHGLRQSDLAARLGLHPDTLGARERGQDGRIGGLPGGVTQLKAVGPEMCLIARRRAHVTQKAVAATMGVSRQVVMAWERGEWAWTRLAAHWGIRY